MLYIRYSKNHHEMTKLGALPYKYMMHMSELVFCQTQISMSHISACENDFHLKF